MKKIFIFTLFIAFFISPAFVFAGDETYSRTPVGTSISGLVTISVDMSGVDNPTAICTTDTYPPYFNNGSGFTTWSLIVEGDLGDIQAPHLPLTTTSQNYIFDLPVGDYWTVYVGCYHPTNLPNTPRSWYGLEWGGGYEDYIIYAFSVTTAPTVAGIVFITPATMSGTPASLSANVSSATSSLFPVVILSISVFLSFYVIQKIMIMFGGSENKPKRRKGRKRNINI